MKLATVCYLRRADGRTLMLHTRPESFQRGAINGPGGKVEEGETPGECNLREYRIETGLCLLDPTLRGIVTYTGNSDGTWHVFYYTATRAQGEEKAEDREGRLEWMRREERERALRWPSDAFTGEWIERAEREGSLFLGKILFDDERTVLGHQVRFQVVR